MIHIEQHLLLLRKLGLDTLEGVKRFEGKFVERSQGRRDVMRIEIPQPDGSSLTFFLKRHWKVNRLCSLLTFAAHFRIESLAAREWNNAKRLQEARFKTASLVAYGEEVGMLGETFSFIITEQASGTCSLDEFVSNCSERSKRRFVFDSLASEVWRLHRSGLSLPDLFTRHVFFSPEAECMSFCFIDVARLEVGEPLSLPKRARCLAALNVSSPSSLVSVSERIRFLRRYAGEADRSLLDLILTRTRRLLRRKRYQKLHARKKADSQSLCCDSTHAHHL